MPVGPITSDLPRKITAFDLNGGGRKGPNAGTEWAGPNEEKNPNKVIDTGDSTNPNRFTEWNDGTVKGPVKGRVIDEILSSRDYRCAVCKLDFAHIDTFNKHCQADPRGNGKEMACEVDKRLFAEKSAAGETGHMMDPNSVAIAVAEALKPTLLSIVGAFEKVNESLMAISQGKKIKKPKKEGKRRASPRLVRGAAPAGGVESPGPVGTPPAAVADSPAEPPPAERPA